MSTQSEGTMPAYKPVVSFGNGNLRRLQFKGRKHSKASFVKNMLDDDPEVDFETVRQAYTKSVYKGTIAKPTFALAKKLWRLEAMAIQPTTPSEPDHCETNPITVASIDGPACRSIHDAERVLDVLIAAGHVSEESVRLAWDIVLAIR